MRASGRDLQARTLRRWLDRRDERSLAEACAAWDNLACYYGNRHSRAVNADLDDCLQAARMGLVDAFHRYEPSRGEFTTYAVPAIRGRLTRLIDRTQSPIYIPAWMMLLRSKIEQSEGGTPKELAERFDTTPESVALATSYTKWNRPISLSALREDKDGRGQVWDIGADDPAIEALSGDAEAARQQVESLMRYLKPSLRETLRLRYWDGLSLAEVAQRLGMSREGVRHREQAALAKMRQMAGVRG